MYERSFVNPFAKIKYERSIKKSRARRQEWFSEGGGKWKGLISNGAAGANFDTASTYVATWESELARQKREPNSQQLSQNRPQPWDPPPQ